MTKVPDNLYAAMAHVLKEAHQDENQGVAIGVRKALAAILACFDDGQEIAEQLNLGDAHDLPNAWAEKHNANPIRQVRGPYIRPPACRAGTEWTFLLDNGTELAPDGTVLYSRTGGAGD